MAILHQFRASLERKPKGGRKSNSLKVNIDKPLSGVFVSSRTLALIKESHDCATNYHEEDESVPETLSPTSSSSCDWSCSSSSSPNSPPRSESRRAYHISNSSPRPESTKPCHSWKSTGSKSHLKNAPLFAETSQEISMQERFDRLLNRREQLPGPWYYSSNHVLVNRERTNRTMEALIRDKGLDSMAQIHAQQMVTEDCVHHVNLRAIQESIKDTKCAIHRIGSNVAMGHSIRDIHDDMMETLSHQNNILDRRYTHFGMGTALGSDGETLYLCQIFRG